MQNLSPIWSVLLPKIAKKQFIGFRDFLVFGVFDLQNDLQNQIWPDPPNITWGCPIFLWFFCQATPYASKFHFKYIFIFFFSLLAPFCWIFHFFLFFSLCIHFLAAGLRTESVLVPFLFLKWPISLSVFVCGEAQTMEHSMLLLALLWFSEKCTFGQNLRKKDKVSYGIFQKFVTSIFAKNCQRNQRFLIYLSIWPPKWPQILIWCFPHRPQKAVDF